ISISAQSSRGVWPLRAFRLSSSRRRPGSASALNTSCRSECAAIWLRDYRQPFGCMSSRRGDAPARVRSRARAHVDAELAQPREVVLDPEPGHELAVAKLEDVDLVDVLEAPARGRDAQPLAPVRPRAAEVADHRLVLRDQVDDLHPEVRERALERADPALGRGRELARRQLVDGIGIARSDHLIDEPTHNALVGLGGHAPQPPASSISPLRPWRWRPRASKLAGSSQA